MDQAWKWFVGLTPHELDVLRTLALIVGSCFVPVSSFLLGWGIKLLRATARNARQASDQTAHVEWVDGRQRRVPVAEYARHSMLNSGAARQETADLGEWVKGNGKRRQMTADIPMQEKQHGGFYYSDPDPGKAGMD